jgi:hypothetical protein
MNINIPLLIFALMIQSAIVGIVLILPAGVTASFPSYSNPQTILTATQPIDNFGLDALSDTVEDIGCSADVFYLNCIASFFLYIIGGLGVLFNIVVYLGSMLLTLILFFVTSGFAVSSVMPSWIAIPFNVLMLAINMIIILDIVLLIRNTANIFH